MTVWYPTYTTQMANNFVKWWKTKFLNGYKQFSVDCNEDHISDTEELLERSKSEYELRNNVESCTTPPIEIINHENKKNSNKTENVASVEAKNRVLNLEELSCNVSLKDGTDKTKPERQEFSFTLYDFDGQGKITKDDIAGLVTTIYEVLGSSIEVPHFGSKVIKVKLTVSPDSKNEESGSKLNKNLEDILKKKDFNVTIKQVSQDKKKQCRYHHQKQKEPKTHYCCRKMQESNDVMDSSDEYSDICSNISSENEETEIYINTRTCKNNNVSPKQLSKHSSSAIKNSVATKDCVNENETNSYSKAKKLNKRSMTLQRQELLEILQANMDKNNLSFHTKRKPCTDHVNIDQQKPQSQPETKPYKHRYKTVRFPNVPFQCLANMINPDHFYVDLTTLHNATQLPNSAYQYEKLIDAVMCVSNKEVNNKKTTNCHRHVRLKPVEVTNNNNVNPFQYHLADSSIIVPEGVSKMTRKNRRSCDPDTAPAMKKNIRKFPQVVLGHTSSHHHLRHRNRQEDKARAMAQVVRWLEQEFSSNLRTSGKEEKTKTDHKNSNDDKGESSPTKNGSNVERHEHHHIHEHIHHHYHHYHDAPVVV